MLLLLLLESLLLLLLLFLLFLLFLLLFLLLTAVSALAVLRCLRLVLYASICFLFLTLDSRDHGSTGPGARHAAGAVRDGPRNRERLHYVVVAPYACQRKTVLHACLGK